MNINIKWLLLLCLAFLSCVKKAAKQTDWRIDYDRKTTNPYSTSLINSSLPLLFPNATIADFDASKNLRNLGYTVRKSNEKSLIFFLSSSGINFADNEVDTLIKLAESGHSLFISAPDINDAFLNKLGVTITNADNFSDTIKVALITPNDSVQQFTGQLQYTNEFYSHNIFSALQLPDVPYFILGKNQKGMANCIYYSIGSGQIILHSSPLLFSNHFLLQHNNAVYLSTLMSYVQPQIQHIYWSSFDYKQKSNSSSFDIIFQHKATATAFILGLIVLIIYILSQMRRKQKIIPIIAPLKNDTVTFVETIGRLYYNKKNHANIAEKMIQHFLEYVRSQYYINTNKLDDDFVKALSTKSGVDLATTHTLLLQIHTVYLREDINEAFIYSLYNLIQKFYDGK